MEEEQGFNFLDVEDIEKLISELNLKSEKSINILLSYLLSLDETIYNALDQSFENSIDVFIEDKLGFEIESYVDFKEFILFCIDMNNNKHLCEVKDNLFVDIHTGKIFKPTEIKMYKPVYNNNTEYLLSVVNEVIEC